MIDAAKQLHRGSQRLAEHPLPARLGYCAVIHEFLSPDECRHFITTADSIGFDAAAMDYPPSYRNNERIVQDDDLIAARLYKRLQQVAPPLIESHADAQVINWRLESINSRIRFCRYTPGQRFNIHQDGVHYRTPNWESKLTFMIYLTDGSEFGGGDTVFFEEGPQTIPDGGNEPKVVARIRPRVGTLILFDHALWHAGQVVTSGTKYIMRSDVLYRRADASIQSEAAASMKDHRGYVWTLVRLAGNRIASGGRDCNIRIWDDANNVSAVLCGHTKSVLGLARLEDLHIASVSRDRTLRIWDIDTGRCNYATVAHNAAVLSVANLGAKRLATGSADHRIKIWTHSLQEITTISAHSGWVWKVVTVDDNRFASASEDGSVNLWNSNTGDLLGVLHGNTALRAIAISPDGSRLATGDIKGRLRVWTDLITGPRVEYDIVAHDAAIRCLQFLSADAIASGGEDNQLKIWQGWPLQLQFQARHRNFVTDIIKIDNEHCASCAYDGQIVTHQWSRSP